MDKNNNILICPLEWGLGHAGRMIPIARRLYAMNNKIFIGSGEELLPMFRNEIPPFIHIDFPGFRINYSRYLPQYFVILIHTPHLIYHMIREHKRLKRIIKENSIDIVISDNRFGLWNKNVKTVFVTHMPRIPFPKPFRFLEFTGILFNRFIIKRYSTCFIPDLEGELNLSGRLSHGFRLPENTKYVGILSRFAGHDPEIKPYSGNQYYVTVILSGPEPQKGLLKQKLIDILCTREHPVIMLEGKPDKTPASFESQNILFHNHLSGAEMKKLILGSQGIITRSGYTTIMELISLDRSALLIPTPGQTEQEYLAARLSEMGWFKSILQDNLDSGTEIPVNNSVWPKEIMEVSEKLLEKALKELLDLLS